jgi:predicted protein tyrosine phosphatase
MFALKITGYPELADEIADFQPTHIVSAINGMKPLEGEFKHLYVEVSDVAEAMDDYIVPNETHLNQVLDFTRDLTDADRLLVHCFAGISRSTALAIGILIQHGMTPEAAVAYVENIRPCLYPNTRFIQLIDARFRLHGTLVKIIHDFRTGKDAVLIW